MAGQERGKDTLESENFTLVSSPKKGAVIAPY